MNPRFKALATHGKHHPVILNIEDDISFLKSFGSHVFSNRVMKEMLPPHVFKNIQNAIEGKEKIKPEHADSIAIAMKEWALSFGATHYTHWFQPLTGATAEKHDSFLDWINQSEAVEKFSGKQLLQGEPDASSFPSGGLRSTFEARGYTGWDPSSPPFLWKGGDGLTLCIPSVFFSWTGDVLDSKIPLLRSEKKINDATLRLLKLTGMSANFVNTKIGLEQEYFVIDRALRNLRPDLVLMGRTVFGASSPKGQELQDHYFAAVKNRILFFMRDFEIQANMLGIPLKTRHNEVAPAQHEVVPFFEKSSLACDHNILLMELMRQVAGRHGLSCLLHEKPFKGINGSGKHCNWSISTDEGVNLLDPSDTPGHNLHFLVLVTAVLHAVYMHAGLLRAAIGSFGNDFRLGGHEAPPSIISVYLGAELEQVLDNIEKTGLHKSTSSKKKYDFGLFSIPDLSRDNTDRNRTSPFAFTGNKFEFRALGSSSNPSFAVTVLNAAVAESLNQILDEIEKNKADGLESIVQVLRKYLKISKDIRFSGDNYSKEWSDIAKKRKLSMVNQSIYAFDALTLKSTIQVFKDILTKEELVSRYEILTDIYLQNFQIETKLMLEMFKTQILPAAIKQQKESAKSITLVLQATEDKKLIKNQVKALKNLSALIESGLSCSDEIEVLVASISKLGSVTKKAEKYVREILPKTEGLRQIADKMELLVDDSIWTLPKYRELLFII